MLSTQDVSSEFSVGSGGSDWLVPEGEYQFYVDTCEVYKAQSSGNLYLSLWAKVLNGDQAGKRVLHRLNFTEKSARNSLSFVRALVGSVQFEETDSTDMSSLAKRLTKSKFIGLVRHRPAEYKGSPVKNPVFVNVKPLKAETPDVGDNTWDDEPIF